MRIPCLFCIALAVLLPIETLVATDADDRSRAPDGMVLIRGGEFEMGIDEADLDRLLEIGHSVPHLGTSHAMWWFGDEIPRHTVEVADFYLDIHEVTNREFSEFVDQTSHVVRGNWKKYAKKKRMDHPVVHVTWHDATAHCEWVGKRLPTEAEWEYAARGGRDVTFYPWGDEPDPTRANYRHQGESFGAGLVRIMGMRKTNTMPVGSFEPNGYGLYDMCGNVSEWCEDEHRPYSGGPHEGVTYSRYGERKEEPPTEYGRVYRGGGWDSPDAVYVRITSRSGASPNAVGRGLGFRCAKSVDGSGVN